MTRNVLDPSRKDPTALKWSAFLLTSCLSTSATQIPVLGELDASQGSLPKGGKQQLEHAAGSANLSVDQIIDEFFSAESVQNIRKAVVPNAWAGEGPPDSPPVTPPQGDALGRARPDSPPDPIYDSTPGHDSVPPNYVPPPPPPPAGGSPAPNSDCLYFIANEGQAFQLNGCHFIIYGVGPAFTPGKGGYTFPTMLCGGPIGCNNRVFGDPNPGKQKACYSNFCSSAMASFDSPPPQSSQGDHQPDSPPKSGGDSPPPASDGGTDGSGDGGFGGGAGGGGGGFGPAGAGGGTGPGGTSGGAHDSTPDSNPDSTPDSGVESSTDGLGGCIRFPVPHVTIPFADALPMDTRYRDMCISGASLTPDNFDIHTAEQSIKIGGSDTNGTVQWNDFANFDPAATYDTPPSCNPGPPPPPPAPSACFDIDSAPPCTFAPPPPNAYCDPYPQLQNCPTNRVPNVNDVMFGPGMVDGAKPTADICMPVRDTANYVTKITNVIPQSATNPGSTPAINDIRRAFSYYVQADDKSTFDTSQVNAREKSGYGDYNFYKPEAFFGSQSAVAGCPADLLSYAGPDAPPPNTGSDSAGGDANPNNDTPPGKDQSSTVKRILFRQFQADWCYKYIILSHSDKPWWTTELHDGTNGDPLSMFDAQRSYLNSCQPLIRGDKARLLEFDSKMSQSGKDKLFGFAPVLRYDGNPVNDQDEYSLNELLQPEWNFNFNPQAYHDGNASIPSGNARYKLKKMLPKQFPPIELPCVADALPDSVNPNADSWPTVGPCNTPDSSATCAYPGPDGTPFIMPADYLYHAAARNTPYCPNVEKIIIPSKFTPFIPRDRFPHGIQTPWRGAFSGSDSGPYIRAFKSLGYDNNYFYNSTFRTAVGITTDRSYSDYTSIPMLSPVQRNMCNPDNTLLYWGYTAWNGAGRATMDGTTPQNGITTYRDIQLPWKQNNAYPVECAIVPVDILTFRSAAFDNCITQRIAFNFNVFMAVWLTSGPAGSNGMPVGEYPNPTEWDTLENGRTSYTWNQNLQGKVYVPPCATRFYEHDTMATCPVKLSIQQCCHIITKDLVPANFVKIRVQEGVRAQHLRAKIWNPNCVNPPACTALPPLAYRNDSALGVHWGLPYTYYLADDWFRYNKATDDWFAPTNNPTNNPTPGTTPIIPTTDMFTARLGANYHGNYTGGGSMNMLNMRGLLLMKNAVCLTRLMTAGYDPTKAIEPQAYLFGTYLTGLYSFEVKPPNGVIPTTPAPTSGGTVSYSVDTCTDLQGNKVSNMILGYNMPYMRWWDTGVAAENPRAGGSFLNTLGGFTSLIGVGREEVADSDALDSVTNQLYVATNPTNEACRDPGMWLDPNQNAPNSAFNMTNGLGMLNVDRVASTSFPYAALNTHPGQMGRTGGLTELYASEAMAIRYDANFCLSRFERTSKTHGAEDSVLNRAGSGFASRGQPATSYAMLGKAMSNEWPWPLGWRGYVTDTVAQRKINPAPLSTTPGPAIFTTFPNFPKQAPGQGAASGSDGNGSDSNGYSGAVLYNTSLDFALPGDIIVVQPPLSSPTPTPSPGSTPTPVPNITNITKDPPKVMFVTTAHSQLTGDEPPFYIKVVFWDQGKFPTSAYSTVNMGQGAEKTIYRGDTYTGSVMPSSNRDPICRLTYRLLTPNPNYNQDQNYPNPGEPDYTEGTNSSGNNSQPVACWDPTNTTVTYDYCMQNCQPDILTDTDYRVGVLPYELWNNATLYRPTNDVRACISANVPALLAGTNGIKFTIEGQPPSANAPPYYFDLNTTYAQNLSNTSGSSPLKNILFQNRSNMVDSNLFSFCSSAGYDPFPLWKNSGWSYTGYGSGASTQHVFCGAKLGDDGNVKGWKSCSDPGSKQGTAPKIGFVPVVPNWSQSP